LEHAKLLDGAIALDDDQHAQAAVDALTPGFVGGVEVADVLDLLAPFVPVPGADIAHGRCSVLAAYPRPLGILLTILGQLRFQAGDLCAELRAVENRCGLGLWLWFVLLRFVRRFVWLRCAGRNGGFRYLGRSAR